jgi:hypothetical protein
MQVSAHSWALGIGKTRHNQNLVRTITLATVCLFTLRAGVYSSPSHFQTNKQTKAGYGNPKNEIISEQSKSNSHGY